MKSRSAPSHRSRTALLTLCALLVSVGVLTGTARADDPPPNPSDGQIQDAQAAKESLAQQVGDLSAQLASLQSNLDLASAKQEQAEQKLALAQSELQDATTAAEAAKAEVTASEATVQAAQQQFVLYAQAVYMTGTVPGTTGTLLTADDPNALLESGALQQYQTSHQISAIGEVQKATIAKSNADAAARRAVQAQTKATKTASAAKDVAVAAYAEVVRQQQTVQAQQESVSAALDTAQSQLAELNNQRATYTAWKIEQARLAEIARQKALAEARRKAAAEKARKAREAAARAAAAKAAAEKAAAEKAAAEKAAADRAAQQAAQDDNDAPNPPPSNGGGTSTSSSSNAPVPTGGSWTQGRANDAVARAKNWLGETYIWAGGNASGPTTGGCTDPIARCGTVGFDCSGLVLYAWAPYKWMPHYAASQYGAAGSYHPGWSQLVPGDLLFWSYDGSISGIHHVAMYVGGGMIIQAPQSGDIVRISRADYNMRGYYGATRPLT